ncbi:hypothetical protein TTHERM_000030419 (macronuclear) [Tetrahymena thermophila SB210]|uniref:Uncharacterized protein n=1 Tax=Tetrahymena thermophila (strain SB210) TaxID=312017 RepID=W7X652_TETTS|nr:hypothetical protein TTHERM_000030419 [Tetrahymena thermophila SB210]EWS74850.1 hypothetical protein TTHERM_000030419 [Tetrahymena thermophila SB210]|eukprot:XP_012652563.1 hypothetical protein TTHERM_000030419 [Tetrahymena thermophila SB210]
MFSSIFMQLEQNLLHYKQNFNLLFFHLDFRKKQDQKLFLTSYWFYLKSIKSHFLFYLFQILQKCLLKNNQIKTKYYFEKKIESVIIQLLMQILLQKIIITRSNKCMSYIIFDLLILSKFLNFQTCQLACVNESINKYLSIKIHIKQQQKHESHFFKFILHKQFV